MKWRQENPPAAISVQKTCKTETGGASHGKVQNH